MKQFLAIILALGLLVACGESNNTIMNNSTADSSSESDATATTDTLQQIPYTGDSGCTDCQALSDEMWMYLVSVIGEENVGQAVQPAGDITISLTYEAYQESMQALSDGDDPEEVRVDFYEAMDETQNGTYA